jgi:hypothetical protein
MKKFWIVLLALGLVAGFAMSASAADVKFSGSYYVYGMYADNPTLKATNSKTATDPTAQAFYHQRLRMQTDFKVAEGLVLVTRFDALEKVWGQGTTTSGWRASNSYDVTNRSSTGQALTRTQENIEFEHAYLDFTTKIGRFNVGYQNFINWGTWFLNSDQAIPGIKYMVAAGPVTVVAAIEKRVDNMGGSTSTTTTGIYSDADNNVYDIGAIYKFGAGEAGILYQYSDSRSNRTAGATASTTKLHFLNPYTKLKFGPVYFEAEGYFATGDLYKYESTTPTITAESYGLYLHGRGDFGPAYAGLQFVFMRGDDPATSDKVEGGLAASLVVGQAYDPCLILWNNALYGGSHRMPGLSGYTGTTLGVFMDNAWFYQIYAGFKPVKQADIMLSLSYAYADKKPTGYVGDSYGTEVDLVAKYKLFDNLEYMIAAGYLAPGNYFKGTSESNKIADNYMLMHKLTLSF